MNAENEFVELMLYVFKAPVIVWPGYEDMAKPHQSKITIHRLSCLEEIQKKKATDYEAMLYISTASLISPLGHEWTKIYTDIFRKYYGAEKCDQMGIVNYEKIYNHEAHQLVRLKEWIYKKQVEALKPLLKSDNGKKNGAKARDPEPVEKVPTLFDFMGTGNGEDSDLRS